MAPNLRPSPQSRERVAILEVDLDDCQQKIQRTLKELRQSRNETREVIAINKELKAQISTLAEFDSRSSTILDSDDTERLESANLKIQQLEDYLTEAHAKVKSLEDEKKEAAVTMAGMTKRFQQVEDELIREKDALERQLFVDAKEFAAVQCQTESVQCQTESLQVQPFLIPAGSNNKKSFRTINHWTQTDPTMGHGDQEVQKESLQVEDLNSQNEEIQELRREIEQNEIEHKTIQKESEMKIIQLLGFKETLSIKNKELKQKIEDLQQQDPEAVEVFHGHEEVDSKCLEEEIERLKSEKDSLVVAHAREKHDIVKKIAHIKDSMLKKNSAYEREIEDLKEQIKKISLHAQNNKPDSSVSVNSRNSSENIISSKEVKITGTIKIYEGSWGYLVEGNFRGSLVGVRMVSSRNIKRFSVAEVYQQVAALGSLRHPNIVLFVAAALDTPEGMLLVTESYTHTLKQVLLETYSAGINRLPAMLDVALALNYLHLQSKPVIHGNLSSSCVAIQEVPGQPWKAKLSDIGIAAPCAMLTRPEETSLVYKDPMESDNIPNTRCSLSTDIYSYGVLMSEASLAVELADVQTMNSLLISSVKEQFPAIFSLIQACISQVPEQRPTIEILASKLQNLVVNRIKLTAVSSY